MLNQSLMYYLNMLFKAIETKISSRYFTLLKNVSWISSSRYIPKDWFVYSHFPTFQTYFNDIWSRCSVQWSVWFFTMLLTYSEMWLFLMFLSSIEYSEFKEDFQMPTWINLFSFSSINLENGILTLIDYRLFSSQKLCRASWYNLEEQN